jgi:hypothetical protein
MKVVPIGNQPLRKRTYVKNRRGTVKNELEMLLEPDQIDLPVSCHGWASPPASSSA